MNQGQVEKESQIDRPWHVYGMDDKIEKVFHSGYLSETSANLAMEKLNKQALELDIETRYSVWAIAPREG